MSTYDELASRVLADDPEQQRVMAAWQEGTRRHAEAEVVRREAEAQDWLTDRVRDAIRRDLVGNVGVQEWAHDLVSSVGAVAAVNVFVDYLRNPPVREIQSDGTETVRWP